MHKKKKTFEVAELELQPIADEELQSVLGMQEVNNTNCGPLDDTSDDDGGGGGGGWCTWYCPWYPPEG